MELEMEMDLADFIILFLSSDPDVQREVEQILIEHQQHNELPD